MPTARQIYYRTVYLKSTHWKIFRQSVLRSQGRICKRCGSLKRLQVHHLCYDRLWNERQSDVEVLCFDCHKLEHKKPKRKKK